MISDKFVAPTGTYNITIYPAVGPGPKQRPVLLLLHGNTGLFYEDHGVRIHRFAEELASLGYVTAVPQYYLDELPHLQDQTPAPHVATLEAAVSKMANRPDVDAERVGLIGYSLGAATAMTYIAEADPGAVTVFVDFFGPVKPYGSDLPIQPPISTGIAKFPPTIIFHHVDDHVVSVTHSQELIALLPATADYRLQIYPTENPNDPNHVFIADGPADNDSRKRATEWIKTHLPV